MAAAKINKVKLSQMLRSGKSGKDCAEYFRVTKSAISQARKELSIDVVKSVALESAHQVVDKSLNAIDQLLNINRKANTLLEVAIEAKDHDTTFRAIAEIRKQLSFQLEIFKTLYDLETVKDFQNEVLSAIGEENEKTRERIVLRLKQRSALRGSIDVNP